MARTRPYSDYCCGDKYSGCVAPHRHVRTAGSCFPSPLYSLQSPRYPRKCSASRKHLQAMHEHLPWKQNHGVHQVSKTPRHTPVRRAAVPQPVPRDVHISCAGGTVAERRDDVARGVDVVVCILQRVRIKPESESIRAFGTDRARDTSD